MKKNKKFWNSVAQKYDAQALKKYSEIYKKTIDKSSKYLKSSDEILELACGTGITTIQIAKYVKKIHAIDLSESMIEQAKEKADNQNLENIEFSVSSIENLNFPSESLDVVTAYNILCFLRDDSNIINKIYQVLKPGGIFLSATDCIGENKSLKSVFLSFFCKAGLVPYYKQYKTNDLYTSIKKAGFTIVDAENLGETPPNYFIAAKKD